ncbi:MAG: HlyC/CorC family transporter [Spirochaetales bacterium]|nr:HlyC/CorC family transporter [Spirochaetales bacterium]
MIKGIVDLSDSIVREVMVPRTDVVFISFASSLKELIPLVVESGHSRFPVYQETLDNIVGILYAKDLLRSLTKDKKDFNVEKIIRKPYFVPESKKLNSLLKEFRRRKVHIAVVVDEYGGTSGIVCLEDIIEEIVGEIQDEFDNETEDIIEIGQGVFLCDARINLEDLNEKLHLLLPTEASDTLGGFVFDLFGKIPIINEKVTYNNIDFMVQRMEGRKIVSIKLLILKQQNDNETK